MILAPDTSTSIKKTVSGTSVAFGSTMGDGEVWIFTSTTDCWIKQGTGVTASAASGSMFVPAKVDRYLDGRGGPDLAAIQDSAGGSATLTRALRL